VAHTSFAVSKAIGVAPPAAGMTFQIRQGWGGGEAVADAEGRRCAAQSDSLGETKYKQAERPRHGADSVCALRGTC
jgi:hypothetical protein